MGIKSKKLAGWLGSDRFFGATLLVFMLETGWLACTSRFPMAFDEAYHFGLIRFFSHYPNPLVTAQAADTYKYGALVQNPSLLYHYLMSFPYRLIAACTHNVEVQVMALRFINVALMVAALLVMWRLLRLLGVSRPLTNLLVLVFALTPLVTVLAAQVNYDNLLILAVSVCLYLAVLFLQRLRKGAFAMRTLLVLLAVCLFSSFIKFAFLPVFAALVAVVAWNIMRHGSLPGARKSLGGMGSATKTALLVVLLAGSFLFVRFYGVNLIRYHSLSPQCDQVLAVQDCRHYYAWNNNYELEQYKTAHGAASQGPVSYTAWWLTVNSLEPFGALVPLQGDLYVSTTFFIIVSLLGTVAGILTLVNLKKVVRSTPEVIPLLAVAAVYIGVLWARNYHDYLRVGRPTFIHGRYLVPILWCVYVLLALGVRAAFKGRPSERSLDVKTALAALIIVSFVCLGGFYQYVRRVDPVYGHLNRNNAFNLSDAGGN